MERNEDGVSRESWNRGQLSGCQKWYPEYYALIPRTWELGQSLVLLGKAVVVFEEVNYNQCRASCLEKFGLGYWLLYITLSFTTLQLPPRDTQPAELQQHTESRLVHQSCFFPLNQLEWSQCGCYRSLLEGFLIWSPSLRYDTLLLSPKWAHMVIVNPPELTY